VSKARTVSKALPMLEITMVSVSDLESDPDNARVHSDRNLSKIRYSLEKFGQQKPIVIDGSGVVLAGNGTLEAAKELGWKDIAVVRTSLKGADGKAYALADNRTSELGGWDHDVLAEQLQELSSIGIDLDDLGWAEDEVSLLVSPDSDEKDSPETFKEITPDSLGLDNKCPKCGFEWGGTVA
jgi:ParB-like chromosome segregation protein Spo0J